MHSGARLFRFAVLSGLLCLALTAAGCGPSYPYYTLKGSMESRVVVIHLDDGKTEEVPAGTGVGAGLTSEHMMLLMNGETVTLEKGAARVTMTAKGGAPIVKSVEYDGKQALYHEPIL